MSLPARVMLSERPSPGFGVPDLGSPLDFEAALARVPRGAAGKGMFVAQLLQELDRLGIERPTGDRFMPFLDYPLVRCMELNLQIARLMSPRLTDRDALRRVAWRSFGIFAESLVGRVLFGAFAADVMAVMRLATAALARTTNVGSYRVEILDDLNVIMHVDDGYFFCEPFGVGMLEGLLQATKRSGKVFVQVRSPISASFLLRLEQ